jgi:hypothetical protein
VLPFGRPSDVAAKWYKCSEDPTLVTLFVIGSVLVVRCGSGSGTASVPQLTAPNITFKVINFKAKFEEGQSSCYKFSLRPYFLRIYMPYIPYNYYIFLIYQNQTSLHHHQQIQQSA